MSTLIFLFSLHDDLITGDLAAKVTFGFAANKKSCWRFSGNRDICILNNVRRNPQR